MSYTVLDSNIMSYIVICHTVTSYIVMSYIVIKVHGNVTRAWNLESDLCLIEA